MTIRAAFNQGVEAAGADRLLVINKVSLIQPLPLAYRDRIARVPGRQGGHLRELVRRRLPGREELLRPVRHRPRRPTAQLYTEFVVPDDQWQAFLADKAGRHRGQGHRRALRLEGRRPHPHQGRDLPGRLGVQPARHLQGHAAQRRPHAVLVPLGLPRARRRRDCAKGLVGWYTVRVAPGADGVAGGQGHRRALRQLAPGRRAPRPRRPSWPRSWSRWATSSS